VSADHTPQRPLGVNVAGFLRTGLGLGEAARLYVAALRAAGVPVRTTSVDVRMPDVAGAAIKTTDFDDLHSDEELGFNLVAVNAPELPQLHQELGDAFFEDRYTIGIWAWETDHVPSTWDASFGLVDEIWTYSRYVADVLGPVAPCPVIRMPLPIVGPTGEGGTLPFALPDAFTFLFAFDFSSTLERKNPLGLIEAFTRAFAPGEGPHLVLKSFNGDFHAERLAQLQAATKGREDIHIVDEFLPEAGRAALVAACDAYVSLHRSEGFGLTLGEAMALGKPVIATGYSGNLDFMTHENSYLVRHGMTDVGSNGEHYPAQGRWAEPDLDHAAELLREVWEDRAGAAARGAQAQHDVSELFSLTAVGELALARLKRLHGLRRRSGRVGAADGAAQVPPADGWMGWAAQQSTFDVHQHAADTPGARGLYRRSALRAMRPYTHHQDELNRAVGRALLEVDQRLGDMLLDLQTGSRRLEHRIAVLEDFVGRPGVQHLIEGVGVRPAPQHPAIAHRDEHGRWVLGFSGAASEGDAGYRGFEDIFRGSEAEIRERQERYLPLFRDAPWVVDLGCGRGEFLDALRDNGVQARGVDLDETMVARCKSKGHDVVLGDASSYLGEQADASVPAAFAAQVIEHVPHAELNEMLTLLHAKLAPGGIAVLETVNPHSPAALKAFWTDTTHQHPLFPEVTLALCRLAGFDSGEVMFPGGSGDFERDIYASRDYAVVARKAPPAP
jgi:hypothetical protein